MAGPFQIYRKLRLALSPTQADVFEVGEVLKKTVSVNPPSIAANDGDVVAVTVTGAVVGDEVVAIAPSDLEAGLFPGQAWVSAANTVQLPLYNYTGGAIDGAAKNWSFVLRR